MFTFMNISIKKKQLSYSLFILPNNGFVPISYIQNFRFFEGYRQFSQEMLMTSRVLDDVHMPEIWSAVPKCVEGISIVQVYNCYITYDMDFGFVPSDSVCFGKLSHFD